MDHKIPYYAHEKFDMCLVNDMLSLSYSLNHDTYAFILYRIKQDTKFGSWGMGWTVIVGDDVTSIYCGASRIFEEDMEKAFIWFYIVCHTLQEEGMIYDVDWEGLYNKCFGKDE